MNRAYLTTPIFYVNAEPHLGHTYTMVVVDTVVLVRELSDPPVATAAWVEAQRPRVKAVTKQEGKKIFIGFSFIDRRVLSDRQQGWF